jgi:hypothetical protein
MPIIKFPQLPPCVYGISRRVRFDHWVDDGRSEWQLVWWRGRVTRSFSFSWWQDKVCFALRSYVFRVLVFVLYSPLDSPPMQDVRQSDIWLPPLWGAYMADLIFHHSMNEFSTHALCLRHGNLTLQILSSQLHVLLLIQVQNKFIFLNTHARTSPVPQNTFKVNIIVRQVQTSRAPWEEFPGKVQLFSTPILYPCLERGQIFQYCTGPGQWSFEWFFIPNFRKFRYISYVPYSQMAQIHSLLHILVSHVSKPARTIHDNVLNTR